MFLAAALQRHPLARFALIAALIGVAIALFELVLFGQSTGVGPFLGAVITGQRFTYSDTVNEAIDMSDALDILRPTDTPLLKLIGKDSTRDTVKNTKHEWLEDDLRGQTTNAITSGLTNTTDPVTTSITTGDGVKFRTDDIVRVENELMLVTATGASSLTLSRGYGGSTNASHGSAILITLIAPAIKQGITTPGEARTTTKTGKYNYTQIFEETVKSSATNQATAKYTKQNDVEYQIGNQMEVLGTNMEKVLIFGRKVAPAAGVAGAMDGIRAVLSTNVYDKAGAVLTQTMLEDALQDVWTAGARSSHLFVNAAQKRRINSFFDPYRQAGYKDEKLGNTVSGYETDFGTVTVVLDRWMPTDEVLIIDSSRIGFGPLVGRALSMMKLPPTTKESDVWEISGEYTAEVRLEKAHARLHTLSTTTP